MLKKVLSYKNFLILTVLIISMAGSPALAQGGTTVRVDPSSQTVQANNTFNVAIKVDNASNLTAFEIHLSYNPAILEATQVANGGFVVADFTAQNLSDTTAGTIDYAIAQMNRPAAQGNGTLLNITFRAKANGSSSIALRATQAVPTGLLLSDQNGASLATSFTPGTVTVGTVTPGPSATPTITVTPGTATQTPPPPTATSTSTTTTAPALGAKIGTHVVAGGESLYCIGRAYKVTPWSIAEANGLWWPYMIYPSQSLTIVYDPWTAIPSGPTCKAQFTISSSPVTPVPTVVATTAPSQTCKAYYTVVSGDTLYSIGLAYGVSYAKIAQANQIANPQLIYPGQVLCIPS